MNEELIDKLQETLVSIIDSATKAAEFAQDEIPQVLDQLLMWKMAESLVICVICVIAMGVGKLAIKPVFKAWKEVDNCFIGVGGGLFLIISGLFAPIFFATYASTALQIWIAPKVYLIEYAASLVK